MAAGGFLTLKVLAVVGILLKERTALPVKKMVHGTAAHRNVILSIKLTHVFATTCI